MGISGNLKTMVLPELLQWLSQGQKTGTLVFDNAKVKKRIFFDQGVIISSASTDPKEYLGHFLASHGYISEDVIDKAVAAQKASKALIGEILVNMGAISEQDLQETLQLKAEESIYDIFTWEEGDFHFLDHELPAETFIRMHLDVQWIVLEGSRRLDEWNRIRALVPSPHCVPVSIVDLQQLDIDDVDKRILSWVDDDRSVEEISHETKASLFQVSQTIAEQVKVGAIKVVRPRIIEVEVPVEAPEGAEAPAARAAPAPPPVMAQPVMAPPVMAPPGYPYPYGGPVAMPYAPPPGPPPAYAPVAPPPGPSLDLGGERTLRFAGGAPSAGAPPAPAAVPSEAARLVLEAEGYLASGDLETALNTYRRAKSAPGADAAIERTVKEGEVKVQQALERAGIRMNAVPRLKCSMDELTKLNISPQQGFMLTRVDGSYDLKSILKMSPMPQVDAQVFFWRLKNSGHIAV